LKESITAILFHSKLDIFYEHLKERLGPYKLSIIFTKEKNLEFYLFKTRLPVEKFVIYNDKLEKV